MILSEFLLHKTDTNDFVYIRDAGYYIGCTIIDYEDLFMRSLNPEMLKQNVIKYEYAETPWTSQKTLIVDIK